MVMEQLTRDEMKGIGQFCIQFTFFIFMWNHSEATARRILQLMLGESDTAMALAVELPNRSLSNAIKTGARDPGFTHIRDHLNHLMTGYDIILGYRNYHVHSLMGIDENGGKLLAVSGKGILKLDKSHASMSELEELKKHVSNWIGYAAAIEQQMGASGDGLDALLSAYQASLEKPSWPETLKKNPVLLQEQEPPRKSSRA
jgi:hypothetical protein